ncbi:glycoside hydrolase family 2 TIM barrel-domain containing protein [Saccharibacillus sacchari]|uniref:Glycoside hydrolase family 2 TIM barrel-domain containing protein n=1 Tax=Saccharibacillus sacchari TaxID=456493 RepID=A0ACC6PEL5_9BACL
MNRTLLFNDGWTFAKSPLDTQHWQSLNFGPVEIPHDWLIADTQNLYEDSIGWYKRVLTADANWETEGVRKLMLLFEGVYMDSTAYVNGQQIGEWKYGYSTFEFDIFPALKEGDNEIVVKVVHQSPNSRWYSGAGLYRNVWLKTRGDSYIDTDGVYVSTSRHGDNWRIAIETEVETVGALELSHHLYDGDTLVAERSIRLAPSAELTPAQPEDAPLPDAAVQAEQGFGKAEKNNQYKREALESSRSTPRRTFQEALLDVPNPRLWSPSEPKLYRLETSIRLPDTGQVIEQVQQNIGFREIEFHAQHGFSLNGQHMKLNGVCEHHDLGALGAAFNVAAQRRRFAQLKEMGVNAIRTAHNMPAPGVMDLADEMGFLVVSESFDMWERPKTTYDYARFFQEWSSRDVRSWVRRDRNHPSLILWSIGNEIYDTHADERGQEVTRMLRELVREFDPRGNAPVTIGSNYMPWENAQKCADIVKIAGYNYAEKYYGDHHNEHPDWIIYGSETASVVQSRGVYHFPFERPILTDDDRQCSALGNSPTSWGAKSAEACILAERDAPYSLGQFIWTGFDYIGEPTPYHTKNSYFGQIDTAGFPKDSYYIYQAAWTDYRKSPMVHIFPYWDFNDGQIIDVRVCSNAPRIELRLDDETVGFHETDWASGSQPVAHWKIPFKAGRLTALAYDENGEIIAEDIRESFGDARNLRLQADRRSLHADGRDVAYLEISATDAEGRPVENATNRVKIEVGGAGRLLGMDNGDSTDYDAYQGNSRQLFSGKAVAIIGSTLEAGTITVRVSSPGLADASFELTTQAVDPEVTQGLSVVLDCGGTDSSEEKEQAKAGDTTAASAADEGIPVPVRKIRIVSESGRKLDAEQSSVRVKAELYPAGTPCRDVEWTVTDDAGILSHLAVVEADGLEATVTALGDGAFRLRCASRSGSGDVRLISQLEFEATGLGTAYHDPYGFVSAGVYDYSRGEVGTGNERGVATSRDGETHVGFTRLDFGPYGADTITLPIFALSDEEYPIEIWAGIPNDEGSELLADVIYQKPSIWNTYQDATYTLSRRLRGIETLCFVLRQKVHIKGFAFAPQSRAFEWNRALDCDRVYGDAFERTDRAVERIGNNVSIEFADMDFGAEGTDGLTIRGTSPIALNTIQIRFEHDNGEARRLVEFAESDGYDQRRFPLEPITGRCRVTFIFLPGSNFDFDGFRFERTGSESV